MWQRLFNNLWWTSPVKCLRQVSPRFLLLSLSSVFSLSLLRLLCLFLSSRFNSLFHIFYSTSALTYELWLRFMRPIHYPIFPFFTHWILNFWVVYFILLFKGNVNLPFYFFFATTNVFLFYLIPKIFGTKGTRLVYQMRVPWASLLALCALVRLAPYKTKAIVANFQQIFLADSSTFKVKFE